MPSTLVIGYEGEGSRRRVEEACRSFVLETVEWEKAEVEQGRKGRLPASVSDTSRPMPRSRPPTRSLPHALHEQTRFDGTAAAAHLASMLRSCMDHKLELTTGGHNVGIDMVPNGIAAQCLRLGTDFLTAETQQIRGE